MNLVDPCPLCGVGDGKPCISPSGKERPPHVERRPSWLRWPWKRVAKIRARKKSWVLTLDCGHERICRAVKTKKIEEGYLCSACAADI